ncbi:uncharacterized protein LOC111613143 [Centruroides sculpturatus]|uniref:uncharacterized protein LOC111613143 n=1 Tax=Centruroides sculpturatus TaxID=218467 RepID=UPI000C6D75BE|nr:uncharacterized protein LOC111613143 [Centruroides sculpturatus]
MTVYGSTPCDGTPLLGLVVGGVTKTRIIIYNYGFKNQKRSDTPTTNEKTSSQPSYLIIHATGEKPLSKCFPFLIQKIFESSIGHLKKIQKLRSGDLLVETASSQQLAKLLVTKNLGDIEVTVTPHGNQGVTAVRRISICRDGKLIPTKHLILTFGKLTLSLFVTAGYLRCPVRPYIPNPLRCFKFQRFGHSQTSCRGKSLCAQYGVEGHQSTECTTTPCCVNCKDAHPAYS